MITTITTRRIEQHKNKVILTISIITATLRRERYCTYHCYDDDDDGYMAVVIIVVNCIIVLITARCDYDYE